MRRWLLVLALLSLGTSAQAATYEYDEAEPTVSGSGDRVARPPTHIWEGELDTSTNKCQISPGRQQRDLIAHMRNYIHLKSTGNITTSGLTLAVIASDLLKVPISAD